ncbi:MAG: FkbM family methyltransferase [Clostridiales bacterium]|nr:FkbM family methyltransferase [Clostridiales bacterium]
MKEEELFWNQRKTGKPVIFWGCGNNAHIVKKILECKGIYPDAFCDNNSKLWGKKFEETEVLSYAQIKQKYSQYDMLITAAVGGAVEIEKQLKEAGEKNKIIHMEKPFKVDNEFLDYDYIRANIEQFETVYEFLEDNFSKELFVENVNFRLCGNKFPLLKYVDGESFFDSKLFHSFEEDNYVDVGAYTGDTLLRYYAFCGGKYKKIYAIEPDEENYEGLQMLVKLGRLKNVETFQCGAWECKDTLTFFTAQNKNKRNFDSPNFFKNMSETIPSSCGIEEEDFMEEKIEVNTVDNLLQGEPCGILKINALAADFQTLRGCKKTIQQYKPVIVGEFGTRKENLTEMLLYMKELNDNYRVFLRQKMIFGDCKTVFTAIDSGRIR